MSLQDLVMIWEIPVKVGDYKIEKNLILAAGGGQVSVTSADKSFVIMVELNPMYYEGAPQRVAVPLSVVQQVQEERIYAIEDLRGSKISTQERLALVTPTPAEESA